MSTLSVNSLILWGRHGQTGDEPNIAQPFEVSMSASIDFTRVFESDSLGDTIDYKDLEKIAEVEVQHESYVLIETLAGRIADKILEYKLVKEVEVKIVKMRPKTPGVPSVIVKKVQDPVYQSVHIHDIDIYHVINQIDKYGGVSVPLLTEAFRQELLAEAETYEYVRQPDVVGPHNVREELSSVKTPFPEGSLLFKLKEQLEDMLVYKMLMSKKDDWFGMKLRFNEISLQLYEAGSIGITSHMDGKSIINLIAVVILIGESKFALCEDREGSNPKYLDTTPGNVILMRAPHCRDSNYRPFHFLTDITSRRIAVGIRQVVKPKP